MTIYVFFPVAVFYYFNLPSFFEKYVDNKRVSFLEQGKERIKALKTRFFSQKLVYPEGEVSENWCLLSFLHPSLNFLPVLTTLYMLYTVVPTHLVC